MGHEDWNPRRGPRWPGDLHQEKGTRRMRSPLDSACSLRSSRPPKLTNRKLRKVGLVSYPNRACGHSGKQRESIQTAHPVPTKDFKPAAREESGRSAARRATVLPPFLVRGDQKQHLRVSAAPMATCDQHGRKGLFSIAVGKIGLPKPLWWVGSLLRWVGCPASVAAQLH